MWHRPDLQNWSQSQATVCVGGFSASGLTTFPSHPRDMDLGCRRPSSGHLWSSHWSGSHTRRAVVCLVWSSWERGLPPPTPRDESSRA